MFQDKFVIVTGGARGIGKVISQHFKDEGAHVCVIDELPNDYFQGDLAERAAIINIFSTRDRMSQPNLSDGVKTQPKAKNPVYT